MSDVTVSEDGDTIYKLSQSDMRNLKSHLKVLKDCLPHTHSNSRYVTVSQLTFELMAKTIEKARLESAILTPAPSESGIPIYNDFLINSGIEKIIQNIIKEVQMFQGGSATILLEYLQTVESDSLDRLLDSVKAIITKEPQFIEDFEVKAREQVIAFLVAEAQKKLSDDLMKQFKGT